MADALDRILFEPPELGCVLYLPGLPGGGARLHHRSPHGNTGTIIGATWGKLPSGLWYLDFDGTDDYVNCGNHSSLQVNTGNLTIELWFKDPEEDPCVFAEKYDGNAVGWYLYCKTSDNTIYWRPAAGFLNSGIDCDDGLWHQIAVRQYSSVADLYIDGGYVNSWNGCYQNASVTTPLHLSKQATNYYKVKIALMRVYNYARSALHIRNDFEREKHLLGVW